MSAATALYQRSAIRRAKPLLARRVDTITTNDVAALVGKLAARTCPAKQSGSGVPWATIGQAVGQRDLAVTANTYTHVLTDERELDYNEMLR